MIKHSFLAATAILAITFPLSPASAAEPLKVVASFSILGDLASRVGGDAAEITTLVGPNGDAHVYEPSPADAVALKAADVILANGLGLEGFLPRLVQASGTRAALVELATGVALIDTAEHEHRDSHEEAHGDKHGHEDGHGHEEAHAADHHDHNHGDHDPHAWQSVENARIYVRNIADAFCRVDADRCDNYRANAEAYDGELVALDEEIRAAVSAVPAEKRVVITGHEAFGYFADAYGMTFLAPEGVSTASEASAADVAALIKQVREDKASAIFLESISNPRLIEQIARETGVTVGGELYSDALSEADGPAATYLDMMRHNVRVIRAAISGS
ncbi:metal ABC transporter solute-binding protein, Zn/Mn family [Tianweitania sediminis]|uniref:Zinc ABC transporter substrate-binding protein n=1 Tax=Tianweitania sediminis TaxID=1502156 RepID=A0A8J7R4W6_9HYPH|nr:zinc ABC transporter substrate-binding protein [Tianweitania sediminis]MBP0437577.1 zinc ABC transporter substrate-binding protein [Tianweitania sediminis]